MKIPLEGTVVRNIRDLLVETDSGIFVLANGKPSYPQQIGERVKIIVEIDENGYYTSAKLAGS